MRRFFLIMLTVVLYLVWGTSNVAFVSDSAAAHQKENSYTICSNQHSETTLSSNHASDLSNIADILRLSVYSHHYDLQRIASQQYGGSSYENQHNASSRSNLRLRSLSEKIMSAAIHSRHARHITKIFEFNIYTSSLRVAYYLHSLCRLRI